MKLTDEEREEIKKAAKEAKRMRGAFVDGKEFANDYLRLLTSEKAWRKEAEKYKRLYIAQIAKEREKNDLKRDIYTIRRDEHGYAVAIEKDGYTVLQLQTGTERNEQNVQKVIDRLNEKE